MSKAVMFNHIRAANSYHCIVYCGRCPSLLEERFLKCGRVIQSSDLSQMSKLKHVTEKYNLLDFNSIKRDVPKILWKTRSDFMVSYSLLIHNKTAEEIADIVMDSISHKRKKPVVIELNPGLGLITKQLFNKGLQKLIVNNSYCLDPFKEIMKNYSDNIELCKLFEFNTSVNKLSNSYFKFFDYVTDIKDEQVIVVGMSVNRIFYRRLIYFILNFSFSCCNNVEFYLTMPHCIYNCMMSSEHKAARTIDYGIFQVLFDVKVLKKYPRDYFLPLSRQDDPEVFFVKITRKSGIPSNKELLNYSTFLKIIGSSKSNNIIGELEKWFPGSGPYFIAKGISPTNNISEFSPQELLRLFQMLKQIRGYEDSFLLMMDYASEVFDE